MPIFAPFSYLANPIVPPVPEWDPSQFTNAQYWWRADLGVTESAGNVSAWEDQINGFTMIQGTGANQPNLTTSSNLNNQSVIRTNGTSEYMYTSSAPASRTNDFTMLGVFRINTTNNGGALMGVAALASTPRVWIDTIGGNIRMYNQSFGQVAGLATNILTSGVVGEHAIKLRYDSSAGDFFSAVDTLSETGRGTTGNTGQDFGTSTTMPFGALCGQTGAVFLGRYVGMDMAEQVMVYGTPTTDEMNDWKTYVNNRYGTIIS